MMQFLAPRRLMLLLSALFVGVVWWYLVDTNTPATVDPSTVLSFEACVQAGYPVMERFPRQCRTPDGRTYAEEPTPEQLAQSIAYNNATADDIVVTNPTPLSVTGKSFRVMGQARGYWYFEASFPVRVLDRAGAVLATGVAQAEGDWMTTEFVPFGVDVHVPESYIGTATLVLEKDNPSGLPEHDASIVLPFTIEY